VVSMTLGDSGVMVAGLRDLRAALTMSRSLQSLRCNRRALNLALGLRDGLAAPFCVLMLCPGTLRFPRVASLRCSLSWIAPLVLVWMLC
jgi:hypothetical protein